MDCSHRSSHSHVYLSTKLGDFVRVNVDKYSSTMSMAISGASKLEGPIIYTACFSGLNFREYPQKIWPYTNTVAMTDPAGAGRKMLTLIGGIPSGR